MKVSDVIKKALVRLLLGGDKKYFGFMMLRGEAYKVDIQPYESLNELMERAIKCGVFEKGSKGVLKK